MWIPAAECLGLCNRSARMGTGNMEAGNRLEREGRSKLIDWMTKVFDLSNFKGGVTVH